MNTGGETVGFDRRLLSSFCGGDFCLERQGIQYLSFRHFSVSILPIQVNKGLRTKRPFRNPAELSHSQRRKHVRWFVENVHRPSPTIRECMAAFRTHETAPTTDCIFPIGRIMMSS